jgi:excisionase family DNA binding protein
MATRCLKVAEVAGLLGVSVDAVYDLINCGALDVVRVGRRMTVPEGAYEKFVRSGGVQEIPIV